MTDRTIRPPYAPTPFYNRLIELSQLEDGWLDGHGKKPSQEAVKQASIIGPALPRDVTPRVYPTEAGGVSLEWDDQHGGHEIEVLPDGHLFLMTLEPGEPATGDPRADAEISRLSTELYYALDAVAFVGEMCTVVESAEMEPQEGAMVSTLDVRQWAKGPQCLRMAVVDASMVPATRPEEDAARLTEDLRVLVRGALETSGRSQASIARELHVSTKYLNQMLQGHAKITLWWAARILRCCGMRLVIGEGDR